MLLLKDTLERKHTFYEEQGLERAYVTYGLLHKVLVHQVVYMCLPCSALSCHPGCIRLPVE